MVQATWAGVASKTFWKVLSATETTVMSRIDMIAPSTTTPATIRTLRSSLPSGVGTGGPVRVSMLTGAPYGPGGRHAHVFGLMSPCCGSRHRPDVGTDVRTDV